MSTLVYWFNLQISKRQHSLKIFERDETRVVQLLLLKPLCISHALVLSLQGIHIDEFSAE